MIPSSPHRDTGAAEIERIRREYARRSDEMRRTYGWDQAVNRYWHTQTFRAALAALTDHGAFPLSGPIADFGCGRGNWLLEFVQWGVYPSELAGIDLAAAHLADARRRLPQADLQEGDARHTPWPDNHFSLVSQFVIFTSILEDSVRKGVAAEMWRVLRPGGFVLWYDFRYNNPGNKQVRAVTKQELKSLFPQGEFDIRSVTLVPPIARHVVPVSWLAALVLEKIPFLRSHYLALIRKPASTL
jgi:ubiquinone/menaquinone biosynthesis C-methylase UbiE